MVKAALSVGLNLKKYSCVVVCVYLCMCAHGPDGCVGIRMKGRKR